ncbi:hypothetical protein FHR71_000390 [Methylobacterium sp. RAS18]|uniref:DUF3072 domain-containing protein n=1 Tax=Methylorubrum extorquens TaxID=408 RepID=UPI0015F7C928|nr:DUF3072 domain-containing protein [Methylorubrum extorquens]MBA9066673.1 hypothetical protein [Methylobacterium sp. RAS18]MCG5245174.1 DUF3072 domain-containing protein [Methylorubrum extorquens]
MTGKTTSKTTKDQAVAENPKVDPTDESNRIKDPDEWTTGAEPMTGAQASYLKTLSEQAKAPEAFEADLDKAEASKRIDALRKDTGKA